MLQSDKSGQQGSTATGKEGSKVNATALAKPIASSHLGDKAKGDQINNEAKDKAKTKGSKPEQKGTEATSTVALGQRSTALQELYTKLAKITEYSGTVVESDNWATGYGINQCLERLLGDDVHIIDPDTSSVASPVDTNKDKALIGVINYIKMIGGYYTGGELIKNGFVHKYGGTLKKPVVMIWNTSSIKVTSSKATAAIGGNHWQACVILPVDYTTPLNVKLGNKQEIVLFSDSLYRSKEIPELFRHVLTNKIKYKFSTDRGDITHELGGMFPKAEFISRNAEQQLDGYDCGWWAVYNVIMFVLTGKIDFLQQFKERSRKPGYALRALLTALDNEVAIGSVKALEKKGQDDKERISELELRLIEHAIEQSLKDLARKDGSNDSKGGEHDTLSYNSSSSSIEKAVDLAQHKKQAESTENLKQLIPLAMDQERRGNPEAAIIYCKRAIEICLKESLNTGINPLVLQELNTIRDILYLSIGKYITRKMLEGKAGIAEKFYMEFECTGLEQYFGNVWGNIQALQWLLINKDLESAFRFCSKFILNPIKDPMAQYQLLKAFFSQERFTEAIEHGEFITQRFSFNLSLDPLLQYQLYRELGYMHYMKSVKEKVLGHNYESYLKKADNCLRHAIELIDASSSYVLYAEFLIKCDRLDDAITNLRQAINKSSDMGTIVYGRPYKMTDLILQNEVENNGTITFFSSIYAYYLLIKVYILKNELEKAQNTLKDFQKIVEARWSHPLNQVLEARLLSEAQKVVTSALARPVSVLPSLSDDDKMTAQAATQSKETRQPKLLLEEKQRNQEVSDSLDIDKIEQELVPRLSREQINEKIKLLPKYLTELSIMLDKKIPSTKEEKDKLLQYLNSIEDCFGELVRILANKDLPEPIDNQIAHLLDTFKGLSCLYLLKGAIKKDPKDLNKAALFSNYVIEICQKEIGYLERVTEKAVTIIEQLKVLIQHAYTFLEKIQEALGAVLGANKPTLSSRTAVERATASKGFFEGLRKHTRKEVGRIDKEYSERSIKEKRNAAKFERESIRQLFEYIVEEVKKYLSIEVAECEGILGKPPCKYSVIGLGSMALKQMTPYSDLEFAILIEDTANEEDTYNAENKGKHSHAEGEKKGQDRTNANSEGLSTQLQEAINQNNQNKEYFRKLSELLHFRIINLGESIVPISQYGICTEHLVRRAVNFDLGGKTPLGRIDKPYELIRTPFRMAQYLDGKYEHVDKTLPYIIEVCTHIHGDKTLTSNYQARVKSYLEIATPISYGVLPNYRIRAQKRLCEGMTEIDYLKSDKPTHLMKGDIESFIPRLFGQEDEGRPLDVKKEIYRLPDRLLYDLGLYFGIIPEGVWDAIDQLQYSRNIIADNVAANLFDVITFATSLRLRTYLYYDKQKEDIEVLERNKVDNVQNSKEKRIFRFSPGELTEDGKLFRFFYIVIPFHFSLNKLFANKSELGATNGQFLLMGDCYDNSPKIKALIYRRLLKYEEVCMYLELAIKEEPENFQFRFDLAQVLRRLSKDNFIQKLMQALRDKVEDSVTKDKDEPRSLLKEIETLCDELTDSKERLRIACKIYNTLIKKNYPAAAWLDIIASIYLEQGEYKQAEKYYNMAINAKIQIYKTNVHLDVAVSFRGLGFVHFKNSEYERAQKCYKIVLEIKKRIYGDTHPEILEALDDLGAAYHSDGEYEKAEQCYLQALKISKYSYGDRDIRLAEALFKLGQVYHDKSEFEKALFYHKDALKIKKQIYQNNPIQKILDSYIASLCKIGDAHNGMRSYNFALICYRAALILMEIGYGKESHRSVEVLKKIGDIYFSKNNCDLALKYYLDAKSVYRKFHKDLNNSWYIGMLHSMGCAYHVLAKVRDRHKEKRKTDLSEAYNSFKQATTLCGEKVNESLFTEFANFLIQGEKYKEAIGYLLKVVQNSRRSFGSLSYHQAEKVTVDIELQKEIEANGQVTIKALIYAYYLLIEAYIHLGCTDKAISEIARFKDLVINNSNSTLISFKLLCSSYIKLSTFEKDQNIFSSTAVEIQAEVLRRGLCKTAFLPSQYTSEYPLTTNNKLPYKTDLKLPQQKDVLTSPKSSKASLDALLGSLKQVISAKKSLAQREISEESKNIASSSTSLNSSPQSDTSSIFLSSVISYGSSMSLSSPFMTSVSNPAFNGVPFITTASTSLDPGLRNNAAVVIQRSWKRYIETHRTANVGKIDMYHV